MRTRRAAAARPLVRLLPFVRPYAGRLAIAAACLVVAAAAGLVFPRVVRELLDAAFRDGSRARLDRMALGLLAVFAVQGVMNYVQVLLLSSTAERVLARLREALFAHLVRLSPGFFTERRTGELTSRLSSDLVSLQQVMNTWVSEFSRQVLFLVGGVVLLTLTDPTLTLTTLAVSPVIVGVAFFFARLLRRASTGVQDRVAEATGLADEAFSQIRTVQGFVREAEETRRYQGLLSGVVDAAVARARLRAVFFGVVGFVAFAGVTAVLWMGGRRVLDGTLTAGALVQFLFYAFFIAAAVGSLASLFGNFQEAIGAAQRVFELLDTEPTVAEPSRPTPLARPVRGDVALEDVRFRYADALPDVLHGVTLRAAPGEVVALVGRSGAGKTTVASLLPRFWDVTGGRVTLDGHDVRDLALAELRGAIGVVPQEPALFSGTVRENIAYARPDATDAEVEAASRAAHAHEFVVRLPQGYDTPVGERGVKLSGGQRQRIALARVFLKDPAVVVLDEATSSLDTESERLVEAALEELLQGRTTLIIAHRLSTVRRADRVVVLDHGRVTEEGTHAELLARGGLYAALYHGQFRNEDPVAV
ncbi:ABC transporter transmembrane domain-containing protein [Roseisolibacter sp. H3M3-2]|uniref:ABC transporter ATP-binding protein n=1 Tax=Roseisolibacter sp. H3M3-2 TaxID=3031323 RepID=UPI0023DC35FF|nr:ABC transporter transmembrane domain-containing protein [Roseisolibacter sp. H3M3-2]MDF1506074.1 ABC transporter transmembrane domain-containing protein [Roseisolibacter sp. H3M3-2]